MKLRCTHPGLGFIEGELYPVVSQLRMAWLVNSPKGQKKVIKSTGLFQGAPKNGPSFELVTVTETQLDLIPQKRRVGRPKTGTALTPAQKQAAYRARKAQETVTVTFNRSDIPALKTLLAQADLSQLLPRDELDRLAKAVFDSALRQSL
ncbi:hypothetical protein [Aeromonas caviae]|uniref:hypothetical protein n=1 Tax=Aeromonas caviae TaxID=648 RepID=UPI002B46CE19|nr:hypothetical protein [Aeromonas caviae]